MKSGSEQLTQTFYSRIPNSPAYSIRCKPKEIQQTETPGPGFYTPIVPFRQSPRAVMSGSKDSFYKVFESPGPGKYEQLSCTMQGFKFPQEKRLMSSCQQSPGPGQYNNLHNFFSPAYAIPKAQRKTTSYSIYSGPGQYNIPALLRQDIGHKIPKSSRKNKIETNPGPADYSFRDEKKRGIKIGTSSRMQKSQIIGPGPADYSPRLNTESSPRAIFGKSNRQSQHKEQSPGPGDYELPQSRSIQFTFPKQNQTQHQSKPSTPFSYIADYTSLRKTAMSFTKAQKGNNKKELIPVRILTIKGPEEKLKQGKSLIYDYKTNQNMYIKVLVGQIKNDYDQKANIAKVKLSLSKYSKKDEIDIVVLPEMALIGYYYPNKEAIQPYLEQYANGPTFEFCKSIAQNLNAYVACGYAERDGQNLYNSAIVVDRNGNAILNIRKKHLFETDKTWAQEGDQFKYLDLKTIKGNTIKLAFGICMDINPWEFKDSSKFELAQFCIQNQVDGLIFMAAWNDHEPNNDDTNGIINYWIWRLNPIRDGQNNGYKKRFAFICADKVGSDEKTVYMGASCVLKLNPAKLIQDLDKKSEMYLLSEIQL